MVKRYNDKRDRVERYDTTDRIVATRNGKQWNDIDDPNVEAMCFYADLREQSKFDRKLWSELVQVGQQLEPADIRGDMGMYGENKMPRPMINAIVETLRYYGLSDVFAKQAYYDLLQGKFRIWDWLGLKLTGQFEVEPESQLYQCVVKMVKLYIAQKDVGGFCWFLRGHDLDVEEPHRCQDCIKSYENWMEEIKVKGGSPDDYS